MKSPANIPDPTDTPAGRGADPLSSRQRVFEAARQLFSTHGFPGTHVRQISKLAGVTIAAVSYHFQGKEKLYEAVAREACRRLALEPPPPAAVFSALPARRKLELTVEWLFERLSADSAWIARLVVREWVDQASMTSAPVNAALGRDLARLQGVIQEVLGPQAEAEAVRLWALTALSQCVFFSLAGTDPQRIAPPFPRSRSRSRSRRATLVKHVVESSLAAWAYAAKSAGAAKSPKRRVSSRTRGCGKLSTHGVRR